MNGFEERMGAGVRRDERRQAGSSRSILSFADQLRKYGVEYWFASELRQTTVLL
jgi:hypothetical protein